MSYEVMVCWNIAFILGIIGFIGGILCAFTGKRKKESRFIQATAIEFFTCWVMFIPSECFRDIQQFKPFLQWVEGVFAALLKTFNIYLGNGYNRFECPDHPVFSSLYAIVLIAANILLYIFLARFIIGFLDGPYQRLRLSLHKRQVTYVFSGCNEKTLAIASTIEEKGKKKIVFANSGKKLDPNKKEKIEVIKGIHLDSSIIGILDKIREKPKTIEVFLFGDKEEDNLSELEQVCKYVENYDNVKMRVYVELSKTPWSLYDKYLETRNSSTGERLVINFVRAEENFAYNNLLKNSIFDHAIYHSDDIPREIKFLLVGMNERNLEMFKAVLHLSQMPKYRLTLMVIDPEDHWAEIKRVMPEIFKEKNEEGDAIYKIIYKEHVSLETDQLERIVEKEFLDFTFAFINVGDDIINANLAMRLEAIRYKNPREKYTIQVNMNDGSICHEWNQEMIKNIDIVGGIQKIYDHSFITMSDIEKGSIEIHLVRYPQTDPKNKTWISYCNNEYNRHSVYARTLSLIHKVKLIDKFYGSDYSITSREEIWREYEHMRWNVYMRTLGYVFAEKDFFVKNKYLNAEGKIKEEIRDIAKIHYDLVNFHELPEDEQKKDNLKLTREIADIMRKF